MPLRVFCGRTPRLVRLRSAREDGAAGVEQDLERLVARVRARWPHTHHPVEEFRLLPRGRLGQV